MVPQDTKLEGLLIELFVIDEAEDFNVFDCCVYHYYYENFNPPLGNSEGE